MTLRVLVGTAFFTLLAFQNCGMNRDFSTGSAVNKATTANNNGTPYYGKPYDYGASCSGPDPVTSRITVVSPLSAFLVKENCQILNPPVPLSASDYQLDQADPNLLYYRNLTFVAQGSTAMVQKTEGNNPNTNLVSTRTFPLPLTAGNLLVCFVNYSSVNGATITSLTDSAGNTYLKAGGPVATVGVNSGGLSEVWYAQNIRAASNSTVSVNYSTSVGGNATVVCSEFSGVATTGALDGYVASSGLTALGDATIGPVTTTAPNDLIVAALWHAGNTPTPGAGYSLVSNYSQDIYMSRQVGASGPYTAVANGVGDWLGIAVAFKTK